MSKEQLEKKIDSILQRNHRVELEKSWETSKTRMISIAVTTFCVMAILMYVFDIEDILINASLATLGFVISSLSMSFIKKYWLKFNQK
jgi:hypothetical protein